MPASLVVYNTDGSEHYNSATHSKLIYQTSLQLTGWVVESAYSSYVLAPWADANIHALSAPNLTIANGRIYIQSFFPDQNITASSVIMTDVYRTI